MAKLDFFGKYLVATTSYGALRKLTQLWEAKEEYMTYDKYGQFESLSTRPMLMGNKMKAFALGVGFSPSLALFILFDDLNKIDIYMKGHRMSDYGYKEKKSWIDIALS